MTLTLDQIVLLARISQRFHSCLLRLRNSWRSHHTRRGQPKSLVNDFSLVLESEQPLAQVEVPEVTASDWVLILLGLLAKVNALVIARGRLDVDIRVWFLRYIFLLRHVTASYCLNNLN